MPEAGGEGDSDDDGGDRSSQVGTGRDAEGAVAREDEFEPEAGSGNVFRGIGDRDADLKRAKAVFAARIVSEFDGRRLGLPEAAGMAVFPATEFARVRNADLGPPFFGMKQYPYGAGRLFGKRGNSGRAAWSGRRFVRRAFECRASGVPGPSRAPQRGIRSSFAPRLASSAPLRVRGRDPASARRSVNRNRGGGG